MPRCAAAADAARPAASRSRRPRDLVPPPAPEEVRVLQRVGAAPNVRLACQLRPHGDLRVTPLLPADRPGARRVPPPRLSARAPSARSRSCSPTCGRSPSCRKRSCRTTWCSCSTAISPRWAMRSRAPAGTSTSSSATASWRCSASTAAPRRAAARRSPPPRAMSERWRAQPRARPRHPGAAADRHRHPYRAGHRGRDGLRHARSRSPRSATRSTPRAGSRL